MIILLLKLVFLGLYILIAIVNNSIHCLETKGFVFALLANIARDIGIVDIVVAGIE